MGWAIGLKSGVCLTDAHRASSTTLGAKISGRFFDVVGCVVVLGPVVGPVGGSWASEKLELTLGLTAFMPVESHVHDFCALGMYVVVYDSEGCAVVGFHGSRGLFVAHFC